MKLAESSVSRSRRTQERAEITRKKLIKVAIQLFSERGIEGVTVREIEVQAGVQRNLLQYHFGTKDEIWKACAAELISQIDSFTADRWRLLRDLSPRERLSYILRSYVRFAASCPEFNRMMVQEGKRHSWRVEWLVSEYLKPSMLFLRRIVSADLQISDEDFVHWYYMFAGAGSLIFSMAPEAKLLFGIDVNKEELIDRHANMMTDFLLSRSGS
ncbi:MAG: TetR family transcriptional regulator [Pseudomonadota bacterium]